MWTRYNGGWADMFWIEDHQVLVVFIFLRLFHVFFFVWNRGRHFSFKLKPKLRDKELLVELKSFVSMVTRST